MIWIVNKIELKKKYQIENSIALDIKKELSPLQNKEYEAVILGCTHYPLLKKEIEKKWEKKAYYVEIIHVIFEYRK